MNRDRNFLDLEGFRYPTDKKDKKIWVINEGRGAVINLNGVYEASFKLIAELEKYFDGRLKLPIKPF